MEIILLPQALGALITGIVSIHKHCYSIQNEIECWLKKWKL